MIQKLVTLLEAAETCPHCTPEKLLGAKHHMDKSLEATMEWFKLGKYFGLTKHQNLHHSEIPAVTLEFGKMFVEQLRAASALGISLESCLEAALKLGDWSDV